MSPNTSLFPFFYTWNLLLLLIPYSFPFITFCFPPCNELIVREVSWVCLLNWIPSVSLERLPHYCSQFLWDFSDLRGRVLHFHNLSRLFTNSTEGSAFINIIRAILNESTYENSSTPATCVLPASSCSNQLQNWISKNVSQKVFFSTWMAALNRVS